MSIFPSTDPKADVPQADLAMPADPSDQLNEKDSYIRQLTAEAMKHAPMCDGVPCRWMSIAQAARCLAVHKNVISSWARRGRLAVLKGDGLSEHRLVHVEQIVVYMVERIRAAERAAGEFTSAPDSPMQSGGSEEEEKEVLQA